MPEGAVYVGRPGTWGNPFKIGDTYAEGDSFRRHYLPDGEVTTENILSAFRAYCANVLKMQPRWLDALRGKDLACWCPIGSPCHADVLLELANQ